MSYLSIEIPGLKEFIKDLQSLPDEAMKEIAKGLDSAADVVLDKAQSKVPVRTGEIKGSIKKQKAKIKDLYASSAVTIGNKRAIPLELGHRMIPGIKVKIGDRWITTHAGDVEARPFLRPAFDEAKDRAEQEIVDGYNRAIEKIGGG